MKKQDSKLKAMKGLAKVMEAFIASHPELSGMTLGSFSLKPSIQDSAVNIKSLAAIKFANRKYTCITPSGQLSLHNDDKDCAYHHEAEPQ